MNDKLTAKYISILDSVIKSYDVALRKAKKNGQDDVPDEAAQGLLPRIQDTVIKITGVSSPYTKRTYAILAANWTACYQTRLLIGIVRELKNALSTGYLDDLQKLIAGEIFDDMLEMSQYLFSESYHLPAIAVAGAVLEDALRRLYNQNLAIVKETKREFQGSPSIAKFNDALRHSSIYPQAQWSLIQSWANIRNHAVHGEDIKTIKPDLIKQMIDGIRSFLANYPA